METDTKTLDKIERILNRAKKNSILKINGIPKYKRYPEGYLWQNLDNRGLYRTYEVIELHKNDKLILIRSNR